MNEEKVVEEDVLKSKNKGVDETILIAESINLSGRDILRITENDTRIMGYEELRNYDSIEQLIPYEGSSLTLLYQTRENYGHWVVIINRGNNKYEFYDSYGLAPDEELNLDNTYHLRLHGGQITPHLTALFLKGGYKVEYNNIRLQKYLKDVNTCGRYTALRVKFKHLSITNFNALFTKNRCYSPDFWASALTLFI